jgi:hypothetical protein
MDAGHPVLQPRLVPPRAGDHLMTLYPFLVLVPTETADETSIGEWLEDEALDYASETKRARQTNAFEFRFARKEEADRFARHFIG